MKNNAPFISYISKINDFLIDNAEDFDVVMPMYNLIKYSNYSETSGSLWNYYRGEICNYANDNYAPDNNTTESKSFK